ncbi:MAG: polysaccharide biosynthesis/export family protein [Bacteroidota bacterium]
MIRLFFFLVMTALMSSCTSYQSLLSYNEYPQIPKEPQLITNFKPLTVQPSDILRIRISSIDPKAVAPFSTASTDREGTSASGYDEYLVNSEGMIEFPTIGKITVKGLRIEEVKATILEQLTPYFSQPPIIQVRLTNFRVNVNGEVGSPGSFAVFNDRFTIIEAITRAGDFTSYSRRDSILIIREQDGVRDFGYVNFNSSDIFSSPYFYLQQNDVVYVRPTKAKVNSVRDPSSRVLPWISAGVSVAVLIFTISNARN